MLSLAAAMTLGACSSMQEIAQSVVHDMRKNSTYGFGAQRPAHDYADMEAGNMDQMADYMSNSDVEIISLEKPKPHTVKTEAPKQVAYSKSDNEVFYSDSEEDVEYFAPEPGIQIQGVPANDPNVVVFPLDNPYEMSGAHSPYMAPTIMPPAGDRPYYTSPFDNQGRPVPVPTTSVYQKQRSYNQVQQAIAGPGAYSGKQKIYFAHGSSRIDQQGQQVLNNVASTHQYGGMVQVDGHASSRAAGAKPIDRHIANLRMSMNRAMKVTQGLIHKGVPAASIKTTAYGDTRPAAPSGVMDAEAASRRVEIYSPGSGY
jgi:outer membrane protein OmpA-like peptidoglycan-associated protein